MDDGQLQQIIETLEEASGTDEGKSWLVHGKPSGSLLSHQGFGYFREVVVV
jgi:hypothetical protein